MPQSMSSDRMDQQAVTPAHPVPPELSAVRHARTTSAPGFTRLKLAELLSQRRWPRNESQFWSMPRARYSASARLVRLLLGLVVESLSAFCEVCLRDVSRLWLFALGSTFLLLGLSGTAATDVPDYWPDCRVIEGRTERDHEAPGSFPVATHVADGHGLRLSQQWTPRGAPVTPEFCVLRREQPKVCIFENFFQCFIHCSQPHPSRCRGLFQPGRCGDYNSDFWRDEDAMMAAKLTFPKVGFTVVLGG